MSRRFDVTDTPLAGVRLIQRQRLGDSRGSLERVFCAEELATVCAGKPIVQINRTVTSRRGTVRGMHFQKPPHAELKIITCVRGEVFDVAVDLRRGSPTFLQWHGEILSAGNVRSIAIPEGFAHGFQTLTDDCEMLYLHTAAYHPESEGALHHKDPRLNIQWPLEVSEVSARDSAHPLLTSGYEGITL